MHTFRLDVESPKGQQTVLHRAARPPRLTELLRHETLPLNTRCGERGLCDGCLIELVRGRLVHASTGQVVEAKGRPMPLRGCEYRPVADCPAQIRIPPRSLLAHEPQVVTAFRINVPRAHDPIWEQVEIRREQAEVAPAKASEPLPQRLAAAVARALDTTQPVVLDAAAERALVALEGAQRWLVDVHYLGDRWRVEGVGLVPIAQARNGRHLGAAIDIGTTTVALMLADLADGQIVGQAASFNRQMHLGDDVLTRINLCLAEPTMVSKLQEAVVQQTLQKLLAEAAKAAKVSPADRVVSFTIAANTTMLHLFDGVDPTSIGMAPFTPTFLDHRLTSCDKVGWKLPSPLDPKDPEAAQARTPNPTIHLIPGAAAYVGADLVAGIFASGLIYDDGPSLLVDVGTNGEIIFKHKDLMLGCATAAGPAFEGGGLSCGIRAGRGAISRVAMRRGPFALETQVIGDGQAKPIGVCGSAYVDFLAQARKTGLLGRTGRFEPEAAPGCEAHLIEDHGARAFRLAYAPGKQDISISEIDIAKLLQAKAAIAAGILTLMEQAGVKPAEIKRVYLAGGFGMHLDHANAIGSGLLPGFTPEQVQVVGNTSLAGAYLALLDAAIFDELIRIAQRVKTIELNLVPGFEDRYIEELMLPEAK